VLGCRNPSAGPQLLKQIESGNLQVSCPTLEDLPQIRSFMVPHANLPMDFANAALVVLCEQEKIRAVFTTDRRGFSVYRPAHAPRLRLLP